MDRSKLKRNSLDLEKNKRRSTRRYSAEPEGRTSKSNEVRQSFQEMLNAKLLSERTTEGPHLGRDPVTLKCPTCKRRVTTNIKWKPNMRTHFIALLLCILVLWPCVCIPYCVPSCGDTNHYCSKCGAFIGTA